MAAVLCLESLLLREVESRSPVFTVVAGWLGSWSLYFVSGFLHSSTYSFIHPFILLSIRPSF